MTLFNRTFAASTRRLPLALRESRGLGIQFGSYQGNIAATSLLGRALFQIMSAVAYLERDVIRERVRASLRTAGARNDTGGAANHDYESHFAPCHVTNVVRTIARLVRAFVMQVTA